MTTLARLSFGLLAAAVSIAAPLSARARPGAPASIIRPARAGEFGTPSTDPAADRFRWYLVNPRPCVQDTVSLVVAAFDPTPCDSFVGAFARDPRHVVYHTVVHDSIPCLAIMPRIHPIRLDLGLFPAGPQRIEIEWVIDHRLPSGKAYTETRRAAIDFVVTSECVTHRLPYVEQVQIGSADGRNPPCIAPGDSIPVMVSGSLPNDCYRVVGIEVLPDRSASPMPHAPRVRVTIDDQACVGRPCRMMPVPWRASVMLPPLPPLGYQLPLEVARVSCRDSYPPGELFVGGFPFAVADSCAARVACILPSFVPGGSPRECDARITPDHPAHIALHLRTSVPLTLLQGELALGDTALRIAALTKTDETDRFFLRWSRTPRGARFTLVADPAETIPATEPAAPAPAVLGIDVEIAPDHEPPPVTLLTMNELVAFDAESMREVPWCPTLFANALRYAAYARICSGPAPRCDVNGDGRADLRDLVLMLRCLRDGTLCGDPPARFDCNGDQIFSIDDVTCCAESILAQDCPGCPPGEARDTRDVKMSFGPPVGRIGALDVPVRIEGAGAIGGARLALRYPDERYEVTGVDFGGAAENWLQLSRVRDGRVLIGLLDADALPESQARAVVTVHLELRPGREPGGELSLESADFSARDGVRLAAHVPVLRQPLGSRLALSESRPNPFAAATRFEVTVERPGPVEVAIFDLSGRKLYTVHRGDLPAGTHEFEWDGRLANGSRASDGVYFYRVDAGNETVARKLVLLRSQ